MAKYYITSTHNTGDEFTIAVIENEAEAIKTAHDYWGHLTSNDKRRQTVEVRIYAEDVEAEDCECFDYDTIDWYLWYAIMRDNEDDDWGIGTTDKAEAMEMLEDWRQTYPDAYLAVIDVRSETCIEEVR